MSDAQIALAAAESSAASASTASTAADGAAESLADAVTARAAAETAKTQAETARTDAQAAAAAAGAQMWVGGEAVTTATVRQAPDGSRIRSNAARTTRATFDPTEQGFWTPVLSTAGTLEQVALSTTIAADLRPIQSSPDYYTTTRPIITFVDDDADPLFYDIWDVIADEKGIDISLAAIAGRVAGVFNPVGFPSMTLAQLRAIRAKGHDILSHGWEHLASYDAGISAATLYTDWSTAKNWFATNFPEANEAQDVLVYPGGLAATEVAKKAMARKLYRYGITTSAPIGASSGNREPVDNFGVYRLNLDTATEVAAKAAIDSAVALGTWLIFMTHDKELDSGGRAANMTKIRNVIDYAVAQGVPIMKFTEAEKIKGNAISIGEYTDQNRSTVISRRGARRHTGAQGSWTPRLYGSTTAGTHTYTQQKGYYQVNGGMVTVKASISIAAAGLDAAMAGNLRIDGLPSAYMPSTLDVAAVAPCNYNIFNLGANYTGVWAKSAGSYLNLLRDGNNVAEAFLSSAQVVAGQTLNLAFVMTYMLTGDPAWV